MAVGSVSAWTKQEWQGVSGGFICDRWCWESCRIDAVQGVRNTTSPASETGIHSGTRHSKLHRVLGRSSIKLLMAYGIALVPRRKSGSFRALYLTQQTTPCLGHVLNKGIDGVPNSTCPASEIGILSGIRRSKLHRVSGTS